MIRETPAPPDDGRPPEELLSALVVDRHRLFAEAMMPLLKDMELEVSIATSAETADAYISSHRPRLALVDLSLPAEDGLIIGRKALAARSDAIVIGVTPMADPRRVRESRRAGFWGCLSKDIPLSRFKAHILAAIQGRPILQARQIIESSRGSNQPVQLDLLAAQLTSRELGVLALLVEGAGGTQIAQGLGISPNTVRTHVQSILTKLQVHSRLEAAAVAVRQGLVTEQTTEASEGAA